MKINRFLRPRAGKPAHPAQSLIVLVAFLAALSFLSAGSARASHLADGPTRAARPLTGPVSRPPTDRIIVQFAAASDPARLSAAGKGRLMERLSDAAGAPLAFYRPMSGDAYVLKLPDAQSEAQVAAYSRRLEALPEVVYAEPDALMHLVGRPTQAGPAAVNQSPDDTRFADQWHYDYAPGSKEGLNLMPAWDLYTGSANTVVAVIDTGIRPHADMNGRILPGYDFIDALNTSNDGDGRDNDPSDPGDWITDNQCGFPHSAQNSSWHGTHVAGTIAANSNNGSDVAGIDWNARILPIRVLGTCGGFVADIADGIRWAAGLPVPGAPPNPHPADVVNLSLGGSRACDTTYQNAFNDVAAQGVVSVVAAGNSAANASAFRPANCNQVITVAATNRAGNLSWYSNYGSVVEISAPGGETFIEEDGILSTLNDGAQGPGNDSLAFYQGTSMAAPHVAGLVSLLRGFDPTLTPAQVLDILQSTARDFPNGSDCSPSICGPGIADAFAALSALDQALAAPELIAPVDEATLETDTPTLEWSAVADAESYHVQVATGPDFGELVMDEPGLTDTTVAPNTPLGNGTYWWRARAADGGEDSPWSDVWSFTVNVVVCLTPGVPALFSPADGATVNDLTPTFSWDVAADATDYEIRIGQEPDVSDSLYVGLVATTDYTPDPMAPGLYYWMVRGRNLDGNCDLVGDWSSIWSVTVEESATDDYTVMLPAIIR